MKFHSKFTGLQSASIEILWPTFFVFVQLLLIVQTVEALQLKQFSTNCMYQFGGYLCPKYGKNIAYHSGAIMLSDWQIKIRFIMRVYTVSLVFIIRAQASTQHIFMVRSAYERGYSNFNNNAQCTRNVLHIEKYKAITKGNTASTQYEQHSNTVSAI
jgi:NADH:ubiquinone oxidoreductase subunit 3 (subunit A)